MGSYRVVIGTTTKAREFPYDKLDEARAAANYLWRWAKQNPAEHGTISLYERVDDRWKLIKTVKV